MIHVNIGFEGNGGVEENKGSIFTDQNKIRTIPILNTLSTCTLHFTMLSIGQLFLYIPCFIFSPPLSSNPTAYSDGRF